MKRIRMMSILLSLALLFSLTACASDSDAGQAPTQDPPAAASDGGEADEPEPADADTGTGPDAGAGSVEDVDWPQFITFLGASSGGNAILSVSAIAQIITDNAPTTVTAQVTPGGAQNMYLMQEGEGDFAWGGGFAIYQANNGLSVYADDPVELEMRVVAHYSTSTWQVAVRKGSGITSMEDLRDKRVVVGAAGGGTEAAVRDMLEALGLYTAEGGYAFKAEYSGVQEGCDMIANGQADATLLGGTVPFSSYVELFLTDKIELIGLTEEEQQILLDADLGYSAAVIPAGSYEGKVEEDLLAVSNLSGLICRADMDDDIVYWITRIMCENWDALGTYHDMFTQITPAEICHTTHSQLHPGAERYYREAGYLS